MIWYTLVTYQIQVVRHFKSYSLIQDRVPNSQSIQKPYLLHFMFCCLSWSVCTCHQRHIHVHNPKTLDILILMSCCLWYCVSWTIIQIQKKNLSVKSKCLREIVIVILQINLFWRHLLFTDIFFFFVFWWY